MAKIKMEIEVNTRAGQVIPYRPKGKRSAKKNNDPYTRITGKKDEPYAYTFREKELGIELDVLNSANGWWIGQSGQVKLQQLVDAYKIDLNDDEAVVYAGISEEQYRHFLDLHPYFYRVKHRAKQTLAILAKKRLAEQVKSGEAALIYLRAKRRHEYDPRAVEAQSHKDLVEEVNHALKKITEEVKTLTYDPNTQEYSSESVATATDARQDGAEHETTPADVASSSDGTTEVLR